MTCRAPSYHFSVGSVVNEGPYCLGTSGQREEEDADLENWARSRQLQSQGQVHCDDGSQLIPSRAQPDQEPQPQNRRKTEGKVVRCQGQS